MDCRLVWAGMPTYNILERHVNTVCRLPKQKTRKVCNGRAFWLAGNYYSPNTIGNANFMCCLIGAKVGRCFAACRDNCCAENLETFLSTVHLNAKRCFIALIIFKCEKSPNYANRSRTKRFFHLSTLKEGFSTRPGLHKKNRISPSDPRHPIRIYHKCAPINKNVRWPKAASDARICRLFNLLRFSSFVVCHDGTAMFSLSNWRVTSMRGAGKPSSGSHENLRWRRLSLPC